MFDHVRIVLVETSHPGNIGAAARAMKNMSLSQLYLVNPLEFPSSIAHSRAAGADDLLEKAIVCADLESALSDCQLIFATSARSRTLSWPHCTPRECAQIIRERSQEKVAILFGN